MDQIKTMRWREKSDWKNIYEFTRYRRGMFTVVLFTDARIISESAKNFVSVYVFHICVITTKAKAKKDLRRRRLADYLNGSLVFGSRIGYL